MKPRVGSLDACLVRNHNRALSEQLGRHCTLGYTLRNDY